MFAPLLALVLLILGLGFVGVVLYLLNFLLGLFHPCFAVLCCALHGPGGVLCLLGDLLLELLELPPELLPELLGWIVGRSRADVSSVPLGCGVALLRRVVGRGRGGSASSSASDAPDGSSRRSWRMFVSCLRVVCSSSSCLVASLSIVVLHSVSSSVLLR